MFPNLNALRGGYGGAGVGYGGGVAFQPNMPPQQQPIGNPPRGIQGIGGYMPIAHQPVPMVNPGQVNPGQMLQQPPGQSVGQPVTGQGFGSSLNPGEMLQQPAGQSPNQPVQGMQPIGVPPQQFPGWGGMMGNQAQSQGQFDPNQMMNMLAMRQMQGRNFYL